MYHQGRAVIGSDPLQALELPPIDDQWVFIVDDDPAVCRTLERVLASAEYRTRSFGDPASALEAIVAQAPQVLIVDLKMPGMSGLELATAALRRDPAIEIIVATGEGDEAAAQASLRVGCSDYIKKPVEPRELISSVRKAFIRIARDEYAAEMDSWLRSEVRRRTEEVERVTLDTLEALMNGLEARSSYFRGHSQSVAVCAAGIARELGLSDDLVRSIRIAGLLHDIGMIAVPDDVVDKPGDLDSSEYGAVMEHCRLGADILRPMNHLGPAVRYVYEHHERLDGSGYPEGKKGDEVSLGGQIVGLAEVWTALTERRAYREGLSKSAAIARIRAGAGILFAEELVGALEASEG